MPRKFLNFAHVPVVGNYLLKVGICMKPAGGLVSFVTNFVYVNDVIGWVSYALYTMVISTLTVAY